MSVFFDICDYLEVTPEEFFAFETERPQKIQILIENIKTLSDKKIDVLIELTNLIK